MLNVDVNTSSRVYRSVNIEAPHAMKLLLALILQLEPLLYTDH